MGAARLSERRAHRRLLLPVVTPARRRKARCLFDGGRLHAPVAQFAYWSRDREKSARRGASGIPLQAGRPLSRQQGGRPPSLLALRSRPLPPSWINMRMALPSALSASSDAQERILPLRFFRRGRPLTRTQVSISLPDSKSDQRGRGSTTARGYGAAHQKLRRRIARVVEGGGARCWRCGKPIHPGENWDLGHDDEDRRYYRGPEHVRCNRATSSRRRRRWQSREW